MRLITDRLGAPCRGKRRAINRELGEAMALLYTMLNVIREEAAPIDDGEAHDDSERSVWESGFRKCPMCGQNLRDAVVARRDLVF